MPLCLSIPSCSKRMPNYVAIKEKPAANLKTQFGFHMYKVAIGQSKKLIKIVHTCTSLTVNIAEGNIASQFGSIKGGTSM